jgi:AcrR family transcriptional regulator
MSPTVRMSADERREVVLGAAMIEFGLAGYVGTSTEAIARRVGVSQPYLFRLFPSKKALFLATIERCFDRIVALFEDAGRGLTGEEALVAMGAAYNGLLDDRAVLQAQLQMWAAACHDEEVRELTRRRMGELWQVAQRISGADDQRVMQFMAGGMLLNVMAAMDLPRIKAQLGEALTGLAVPTG